MNTTGNAAVHLELKYCERCGGLGLRPRGSAVIFCTPCARVMAGLAPNSNLSTHVLYRPCGPELSEQCGFGADGGEI